MIRSVLPSIAVLAGLALALSASAHVPSAKAVARAAAKVNRDAGRARGVELEVALFSEGSEDAEGTGRVLLDPAGRSRLEIVSSRGVIERQLWSSGRRNASLDGELEPGGRILLPPLHLLQASSSGELQSALSAIGGRSGHVVLGHDGAHDAWVLGGRDGAPAAWVDTETHVIFRLDWGTTRAHLVWPEPATEASWPTSIELEREGSAPLRLEIRGEKPAKVSADKFAPGWLTR